MRAFETIDDFNIMYAKMHESAQSSNYRSSPSGEPNSPFNRKYRNNSIAQYVCAVATVVLTAGTVYAIAKTHSVGVGFAGLLTAGSSASLSKMFQIQKEESLPPLRKRKN